MRKVRDGERWGDWQFDAKTLTLVLNSGGRHDYEIDLESIKNSAELADWIFQLKSKAWATREILGDLISAFYDLLRPQQTICGGGVDHAFDPTAY